jgi:hypothetical protein
MNACVGRIAVLVASLAAAAGAAEGQSAARLSRLPSIETAASVVSSPPVAATIFGYVWRADNSPIPGAALRLRNVVSGRIEMTSTSNESGEFSFTDVEGATYAIEYVDERSRLLAVGHTFSIAPGETVVTFIRLGSRLPWVGGLFSSAAAAVVSSAAGIGVTAVVPTGQDISPVVP